MDGWTLLIGFSFLGMLFFVAPTIIYVFCIPKFIRFACRQESRSVTVALVAVYFLAPAVSWLIARQSADAAAHEAQALVDAIPVAPIDGEVPTFIAARGGMVLRAINLSSLSCPKPKIGNDIIYLLTPKQLEVKQMLQRQHELAEARKPRPKRFLILENDDAPPYPTEMLAAAGGKTKRLYLHDNGRETLIGVHFIPYVPGPIDIPIMTLYGWYKKPNIINAKNDHVNDFLRSTLHVKCIDLKIIGI